MASVKPNDVRDSVKDYYGELIVFIFKIPIPVFSSKGDHIFSRILSLLIMNNLMLVIAVVLGLVYCF